MTRETTPATSETPAPLYNHGDKAYINGKEVTINMPVPEKPGYYYIQGDWADRQGNKTLGPEYDVNILKPSPK